MEKGIIMLLCLMLTLGGCTLQQPPDGQAREDDANPEIQAEKNMTANEISNLLNGGSFYQYGDEVYGSFFENYHGFLLGKYHCQTGEYSQFDISYPVSNVIVHDDSIYFRDFYPTSGPYEAAYFKLGYIYRTDLNGEDIEKLSEEIVSIFYVYDGYIYSQYDTFVQVDPLEPLTDHVTKIFKISLDGLEKELVFQIEKRVTGLFVINDDRIYLPTEDGVILFDLTSGSELNLFEQSGVEFSDADIILPLGDTLYFNGTVQTDADRRSVNLYSVDIDTLEIKLLAENLPTSYFAPASGVALSAGYDGLREYNIQTGQTRLILDGDSGEVHVIGVIGGDIYIRIDEYIEGSRTRRPTLKIIPSGSD